MNIGSLRDLSRQVQVYLTLYAGFALAALQNVTVDDAVLIGAVVPQYLPVGTGSSWAQGSTCSGCLAKPDPTLAYNGTWHDSTYSPNNSFAQEIELTFTGSAVYIFFIIANAVPWATTLTDVQFLLDGDVVGTYTHNPTSSTDYEYNVAVYSNNSVPHGEHDMRVQPRLSASNGLMLFDYLIYTVDNSSTSTVSSSPSATSSSTTSSKSIIGGAVGGAVGGAAAFAIMAIFLLCFWRRRKRRNHGPSVEEVALVDPFISSYEVTLPPTLAGVTGSVTEPRLVRSKTGGAPPETTTITPPDSTIPTLPSPPSSQNNALIEQVEQLRDEVARLRDLHDSERNVFEMEPPPEYS